MFDANQRGRLSVEINPETTPVSGVAGQRLACGAGRALSAIFS
jgi:hypothetical protein